MKTFCTIPLLLLFLKAGLQEEVGGIRIGDHSSLRAGRKKKIGVEEVGIYI